MQRSYLLLVLVTVAGLRGCTPEPYLRLKGAVTSTIKVSRPTFDASGLKLNITGLACHVSVVEHWCPVGDPQCRPDPTVTKDEPVDCPQNVMPGKFSLHTPWGQVYPSTLVAGLLDVKIDWNSVVIDSLDGATLRAGWAVRADDGAMDVDAHLALTDDELHALLATVREATGNDYSEAPVGEHAALTVMVSNEPNASDENHVVVSVTNHGPAPAYRVVATFKSRVAVLQGIKLSFGRIDRAETKKQAKDLATPHDADGLIDVEVTSSNAAPALAPHGIRLRSKRVKPEPPPAPPQLSCSSRAKQATAGQRLRVECEASNPGDKPMKGMTYQVSVANAAPVSALGPTDLAPHTPPSKFDVDVALPTNTTPGSLKVTVTASAPKGPPVQQDISVDVVEPHKLCKPGELTIDDYRRKHKVLDEDRNAGLITKEQFNDDLAELWSCVRQH